MPYRLTVSIIDPGDKLIHVEHLFYGATEADARKSRAHHLQTCSYFAATERDGYTDEVMEQIPSSEWPQPEPADGPVIDMEPVEDDEED